MTAAKVRERLARRRQVEEAVLVEAAAAVEAVQAAELALHASQERRSLALGTVAWLLPEAEAAGVLGVAGQALRAAKRTVTAPRAQQLRAQLAGDPDAASVSAAEGAPGETTPAAVHWPPARANRRLIHRSAPRAAWTGRRARSAAPSPTGKDCPS